MLSYDHSATITRKPDEASGETDKYGQPITSTPDPVVYTGNVDAQDVTNTEMWRQYGDQATRAMDDLYFQEPVFPNTIRLKDHVRLIKGGIEYIGHVIKIDHLEESVVCSWQIVRPVAATGSTTGGAESGQTDAGGAISQTGNAVRGGIVTGHTDIYGQATMIGSASGGIDIGHIDLGGAASLTGAASGGVDAGQSDAGGAADSFETVEGGLDSGQQDAGGVAVVIATASGSVDSGQADAGGVAAMSGSASGGAESGQADAGGTADSFEVVSGGAESGQADTGGAAAIVAAASGGVDSGQQDTGGAATMVGTAAGGLDAGQTDTGGSADSNITAAGGIDSGQADLGGAATLVGVASGGIDAGQQDVGGAADIVATATGGMDQGQEDVGGAAESVPANEVSGGLESGQVDMGGVATMTGTASGGAESGQVDAGGAASAAGGGGLRSDTEAHITRVEADGGVVADSAFLDGLLQEIEDQGVLADLVFLAGPNVGHKLNTGAVEKLYDVSSNNNDPTQTTAGARPVLETPSVTEQPMLKFDGTDDHMDIATTVEVLANAATVIVTAVAEEGSTDANDWAIGTQGSFLAGIRVGGSASRVRIDDTNQDLNHADIAQDEVHAVGLRSGASNSWTFYFNAETSTFTETGSFEFDAIGSRNQGSSEHMDGHVGEVIAFDSDIGETALNAIRDYIKNYYKGGYRYEALGHRKRVVDDGGTVRDISFLSDLIQLLDDQGIISSLTEGYGSLTGMNEPSTDTVDKIYDFGGTENDAFVDGSGTNPLAIEIPPEATKAMIQGDSDGRFNLVSAIDLNNTGSAGFVGAVLHEVEADDQGSSWLFGTTGISDGFRAYDDSIRFRPSGSNNDWTVPSGDRANAKRFRFVGFSRDASNVTLHYDDGVNTSIATTDNFVVSRLMARAKSDFTGEAGIWLFFSADITAAQYNALRSFIETYFTT